MTDRTVNSNAVLGVKLLDSIDISDPGRPVSVGFVVDKVVVKQGFFPPLQTYTIFVNIVCSMDNVRFCEITVFET
jgi:hypothetical protein